MKTVKISRIIKKLRESNKAITESNIITESLFIAGGTITAEDVKEYFKKPETKMDFLQRKNRLVYFLLQKFTDKEKLAMLKTLRKSNTRLTVKISKMNYLYTSITDEKIKEKAMKIYYN